MEINMLYVGVCIAASILILGVFYFSVFRRQEKICAAYSLYKARDEILYHLIKGDISDNSTYITYLYKNINLVLMHYRRYCLKEVIRSVLYFSRDTSSLREKFFEEVKASNEDLQMVALEYFEGIKEMLIINSISLRILTIFGRRFTESVLFRLLSYFWNINNRIADYAARNKLIAEKASKIRAYKTVEEFEDQIRLARAHA